MNNSRLQVIIIGQSTIHNKNFNEIDLATSCNNEHVKVLNIKLVLQ